MSPIGCRGLAAFGAALCLFALAPCAFASRANPFALAPITAAGTLKSMAVGDVDGDGRADLVSSACSDSSLGLSRSAGAGAFAAREWLGLLPVGKWANSLDLIDLDGDGHLDLVASADDSLHAFPGNGDGTFAAPFSSAFATGALESNMRAWADLDDDGRLDLLAPTTAAAGAVLVAHGLVSGGFAPAETIWMPHPITYVRMADANADGRLDLFAYDASGSAVSVRIAMVGEAWTPAVTSYVSEVRAVGDQDGDGRADLWSLASANTSVWRGAGDGTFTPGPLSPGMAFMPSIEPVIADQDGDGRGDLLGTVWLVDQGALVLLRSRPDGSLLRVESWGTGAMPAPFAMADVDGDGLLDAVTGSRDEGTVHVQLGLGPERFAARTLHGSGADGRAPSAIALADLNRDGRADLLFESSFGNQLTVYHSMPGGVLAYVQDLLTPTYPEGLTVADIDGDGWPDVAIAGADGPIASQAFSLNQGDGVLLAPTNLAGLTTPSASQVLAGHFDDDAGIDLLYAGASYARVAWYQAPGLFTPLDSVPVGGCMVNRVAVGRVDQGPLDDMVFLSGMDSLAVALSDGMRGFQPLPRMHVDGLPTDIALRDLDIDSRADVILLDVATSSVMFLKALGTGVFAAPVRYPVGEPGSYPISVAIGDVDSDGYLDLVVSNARDRGDPQQASATVWYNDQHSGFLDRADFVTGPHGGRLALGDVDGNGTLDLAVANGRGSMGGTVGSDVSVMLNAFSSPPASIGVPLAANTSFALPRAWPNPLRQGANLRLDLVTPMRGEVRVELLDLQGRRVREQSYRALDAGRHSLALPSQGVPPGLYFVRATQGSQRASQRVVVL